MSDSSKFAKQIRIDSTTEETYKSLNPTQKRSFRDSVSTYNAIQKLGVKAYQLAMHQLQLEQ